MGISDHNLQGQSPGYKSAQGNKSWALSIQQKFRFEIWKIPRTLLNGKFRLHESDPGHRAFDSRTMQTQQKPN